MPKFNPYDMVGKRYGSLEVRQLLRKEPYKGRFQYIYEGFCTHCNNPLEVARSNLVTGHTQSCGCLRQRVGADNPCWGGCGEISASFWKHILKHAETRSLHVEVTLEDVWTLFQSQNGRCSLTGQPLKCGPRQRDRTASLDRVDNRKGYVLGNIQWVHKDINWMKGRFKQSDFIRLCVAVADHQQGNSDVD